MKKPDQTPKSALDLMEESLWLLNRAPVVIHVCYYTGAIPFVLGLLYFWSDMSRGAFAFDHLAASSLGVALLYFWMKSWQSVSASLLLGFVSGATPTQWTFRRIAHLVITQASIQSLGLFIRPVALLITLPYGWVRAFFENAVILGNGELTLEEVWKRSNRQAFLWPKQNHLLLSILLIFGFIVWMNLTVLLVAAPFLLKLFTGIETAFTQSKAAFLNTTFLAVTAAAAYLCVNPIIKAAYVLRCFYGESVHSGGDLRVKLKRLTSLILIVLGLMLSLPSSAKAAPAHSKVDAVELNSAINRVLKQEEFAWRLPRQKEPESKDGALTNFFTDAWKTFKNWARPVKNWFEKIFDQWGKKHNHKEDLPEPGSFDWLKEMIKVILGVLCVLIVSLLGWLVWKNKRNRQKPVHSEPVAAMPDLASEEIMASHLPEDTWLDLAREMVEKGELRLAMRAFYLAVLAHLSLRELITIARHKSNHDYERELQRRARLQAELLSAFHENLSIFEGAWYGSHPVTEESLGQFAINLERIRSR